MDNGSTANRRPTTAPPSERFTRRHGAKALVTSGRRVLLVRERHADGSPFWTLPGGGVETHETPREGLGRELFEELRCGAHVGKPVTAFWYAHRSLGERVTRYTVFECSLRSAPTPNHAEGVFESRWVTSDTLPPGTLPQVCYICQSAAPAED